jgi:hypothetical protein
MLRQDYQITERISNPKTYYGQGSFYILAKGQCGDARLLQFATWKAVGSGATVLLPHYPSVWSRR